MRKFPRFHYLSPQPRFANKLLPMKPLGINYAVCLLPGIPHTAGFPQMDHGHWITTGLLDVEGRRCMVRICGNGVIRSI